MVLHADFVGLHTESQGARIGRDCFIDSLELCDCDLLNVSDEVVINEGASLIGHYFKDGHLHFGEVQTRSAPSVSPGLGSAFEGGDCVQGPCNMA